jgi:hypothetical protein
LLIVRQSSRNLRRPDFAAAVRFHLCLRHFLKMKVFSATEDFMRVQCFVHFRKYLQFIKVLDLSLEDPLVLERFVMADFIP